MIITDINPVASARAIPLELIEQTALAIQAGYEMAKTYDYKRIHTITPLPELVAADLTYSKKNCEWYQEFYKELVDITKVANIFKIPELYISSVKVKASSLFMMNPLNIHSPLLDEYYQELISQDKEKYNSTPDVYLLSRLILVALNPTFEDFVKGVPPWYVRTSDVILEAYDTINRRHIRIVRGRDKLHYLTAIISDNWVEIKDVPKEMDIVVQYLISNRANLAFANEG